MTNEDKILELLMNIQQDIVELKQGQTQINDRLTALETKVDRMEERIGGLEERMGKLEIRAEEIRKNQYATQDDLMFVIRKTVDHMSDIQVLKRAM